MSLQACPNAQQIAADAGRRAREFAMWAVLLALASGGCLVASGSPVLPIAAFGCLAVLLAIWHSPKFGVLLLFAGALILECDDSHYPRSVARGALMPVINVHILPFFRPTHEFVKPLHGFFLSPAEICMILIPAICLLQAVYARRFRFERGPFWPLFAILLACWMVGVVNGAATGGDLRLTFLVELRGQSYGIILYLLTYNLLTRRRDLDTLGWMILIGCGIRSIECLLLYFVTFHRDVSWYNTGACLLEHHESFLFNGYFFYTLLLFVTGGPKAQKHVALWLLPIVVVANVLNHRRASTAAAVVTLLALLPLLYAVFREKRASLLRMIAAGAVCTTLYVGLLWNSNSVIAQPIQAIRSQFTPSARDESSDLYREMENKNLLYTIRTSPILGFGFGKEFLRPYPLIDLRKKDPYLFLRPHNCILWIWLRLGAFGFAFFWFINAYWIARGYRIARRHTDNWIRHWAVFAVVIVVINLAIAKWDMGLYGLRTQIYLGVMLGVLDRLPLLARDAAMGEERGES